MSLLVRDRILRAGASSQRGPGWAQDRSGHRYRSPTPVLSCAQHCAGSVCIASRPAMALDPAMQISQPVIWTICDGQLEHPEHTHLPGPVAAGHPPGLLRQRRDLHLSHALQGTPWRGDLRIPKLPEVGLATRREKRYERSGFPESGPLSMGFSCAP